MLALMLALMLLMLLMLKCFNAGLMPCSIFYNRLRSCAINCDRAIIWKPKLCDLRSKRIHNILNSDPWFNASLQQSNRLFLVNMAGVEQGNVSNEKFMEEVARYQCVYHRNSKDLKDKNKEANCWKKRGRNLIYGRLKRRSKSAT